VIKHDSRGEKGTQDRDTRRCRAAWTLDEDGGIAINQTRPGGSWQGLPIIALNTFAQVTLSDPEKVDPVRAITGNRLPPDTGSGAVSMTSVDTHDWEAPAWEGPG